MKSFTRFKTESKGVFKNTFDSFSPADLKDLLKNTPALKLVKVTLDIVAGVDKAGKAWFKYDKEALELISDFTPLDFTRGRVQDKIEK